MHILQHLKKKVVGCKTFYEYLVIYNNFNYIPKTLLKDNYIPKISKKKFPKGVEVLEACRQAHHCEDLTCTFFNIFKSKT